MDMVKVYYDEEIGGFMLFNPDGSIIPCVQNVSVSDDWVGSKCGNRVTVTANIMAELVNAKPKKDGDSV